MDVELRRLNMSLAQQGLRICRVHRGVPLPLTDEHFQYVRTRGLYESICRKCKSAAVLQGTQKRYQTDPEFRQRQREANLRCYHEHREQRLLYKKTHPDKRGTSHRLPAPFLPIPPGMRAVVYDQLGHYLRVWNERGERIRTEACTLDVWEVVSRNYIQAGYFPVEGWPRFEVLAHFEMPAQRSVDELTL